MAWSFWVGWICVGLVVVCPSAFWGCLQGLFDLAVLDFVCMLFVSLSYRLWLLHAVCEMHVLLELAWICTCNVCMVPMQVWQVLGNALSGLPRLTERLCHLRRHHRVEA